MYEKILKTGFLLSRSFKVISVGIF